MIDADGHASLDDEGPQGALRDAIGAALEQSTFAPAEVNGARVSARVRVAWRTAEESASAPPEPPPSSTAQPAPSGPSAAAQSSAAPALSEQSVSFGATGRIEIAQPTQRRLEPIEMRALPGAFGDPFRVVDALPGVIAGISGLPYVYVRGAPPASTNYYYDSIQVPILYHLALGPAVVHPALLGPVDFYASVAPARYGRHTGGVLAGQPSDRAQPGSFGGEFELRLIDVMGMVELPLLGGELQLAGRYGYPGLVVGLFSPETLLAYWDYQTRLTIPLSEHDRFQFTWFGSYDSTGTEEQGQATNSITLEFHRAEARLIHEVGRLELGSALLLGYDRSEIENGLQAESLRVGPRMYAQWRGESGFRLRAGAEFLGIAGEITAPEEQQQASLGITFPLYEDVAARSTMSAYTELHIPLHPQWLLDAGLRSDVWLTGTRSEVAVDPRTILTFRASDTLALHVAGGLAHQPAVFLIPLPGIADVGLERGLQRAVQSEAGFALDLPEELRLESQAYLQYYTDMIFPDLAIDQSEDCDSLPSDVAAMIERCKNGYPRASVWAYGVEVFLRRKASEALSGWLSYTLGFAEGESEEGYSFTPSFDVRHILNLVLQYRLSQGWHAGARMHLRTGKMASATFLRESTIHYEQRLPGFFRTDLQLSYGWPTSFGSMRVALEWFNATLSREPIDIECEDGVKIGTDYREATPCRVKYAPALFFPNLGVRAEF